MPIDASIPLSFRPTTEMMSPVQALTLKDLAQRVQAQQVETQKQQGITQLMKQPGSVDPKTGMVALPAIAQAAQIDPFYAFKLQDHNEKVRLNRLQISQEQQQYDLGVKTATLSSYKRHLSEGMSRPEAIKAANLDRQNLISEDDRTGRIRTAGFDDQDIKQAMGRYIDNPEGLEDDIIRQGGKLPDVAAPRTRNRIEGTNEVQEQYNTRTGQWEKVGGGPRFKPDETKGGFEGKNGELLAALAEKGVSLPAGFRSKTQQLGLLNSLRERNPSLSPDEIADKVKNGQIDLANVKKAGQVAAGIAGKVAYAENELEQTIPLVREASAKLPRGQFIPFNKLKQMSQDKFSNPDLAEFRMYMTSLSNAYDMLAARGGTDVEKRAEGRRNFETAQSPEALEAVLRAVQKEAQASGRAAQAAMKPPGSKKEQEKATSKSGRPMHKNEDGKWEYD